MKNSSKIVDVLILGAGPAGLGIAIALKEFTTTNILVIDAKEVGHSFNSWPKETRFISPSFTAHQFNLLDLNAITYATSPGYTLGTEHPTGKDYAEYLKTCVKHFDIPVKENTKVISVTKEKDIFICETSHGTYHAQYVVSALGEFSFPKQGDFIGSGLCRHTSHIPSYKELEGDNFIIIGGYESGVDGAIHLSRNGKHVTVIDSSIPWNTKDSDPSAVLSPFTLDRLNEVRDTITFVPHEKVIGVTVDGKRYSVVTNENTYTTQEQPLFAGGFNSKNDIVSDLFSFTEDGFPQVTKYDESTKVSGVFLVGPKLKHGGLLFCFIYKFRLRFGIVAEAITRRLGKDTKESIKFYREKNMYLDDLSCCATECTC